MIRERFTYLTVLLLFISLIGCKKDEMSVNNAQIDWEKNYYFGFNSCPSITAISNGYLLFGYKGLDYLIIKLNKNGDTISSKTLQKESPLFSVPAPELEKSVNNMFCFYEKIYANAETKIKQTIINENGIVVSESSFDNKPFLFDNYKFVEKQAKISSSIIGSHTPQEILSGSEISILDNLNNLVNHIRFDTIVTIKIVEVKSLYEIIAIVTNLKKQYKIIKFNNQGQINSSINIASNVDYNSLSVVQYDNWVKNGFIYYINKTKIELYQSDILCNKTWSKTIEEGDKNCSLWNYNVSNKIIVSYIENSIYAQEQSDLNIQLIVSTFDLSGNKLDTKLIDERNIKIYQENPYGIGITRITDSFLGYESSNYILYLRQIDNKLTIKKIRL